MPIAVHDICPCGCGQVSRPLIPGATKHRLKAEVNFICQSCHTQKPESQLEIDHIYPWAKGGPNIESNWQVLCKTCNLKKAGPDRRVPHRGMQLTLARGLV